MCKAALFPCGDDASRKNFVKTVMNNVDMKQVYEMSSSDAIRELLDSIKDYIDGIYHVWGINERHKKHIANQNFKSGKCYFSGDGIIFSEAEVLFHSYDENLCDYLWGRNNNRKWNNIFILKNVRPCYIGQKEFTGIVCGTESYVRSFRIVEIDGTRSDLIEVHSQRNISNISKESPFGKIGASIYQNAEGAIAQPIQEEVEGNIYDESYESSGFVINNENETIVIGAGKEIRVRSDLLRIKVTNRRRNIRIIFDGLVNSGIDKYVHYDVSYNGDLSGDNRTISGIKRIRSKSISIKSYAGKDRVITLRVIQSSKNLDKILDINPELKNEEPAAEQLAADFRDLHNVSRDDLPRKFAVMVHGLGSNCMASLSKLDRTQIKIPIYRFEHKSVHTSIRENAEELGALIEGLVKGDGEIIDDGIEIIFISHSRGGLVAKWAASKLKRLGANVRIISFGTPYLGTNIAFIPYLLLIGIGVHVGTVKMAISASAIRRFGVHAFDGVKSLVSGSQVLGAIASLAGDVECKKYGGITHKGTFSPVLLMGNKLVRKPNDGVVSIKSSLEDGGNGECVTVGCNHFDYFSYDDVQREIYAL